MTHSTARRQPRQGARKLLSRARLMLNSHSRVQPEVTPLELSFWSLCTITILSPPLALSNVYAYQHCIGVGWRQSSISRCRVCIGHSEVDLRNPELVLVTPCLGIGQAHSNLSKALFGLDRYLRASSIVFSYRPSSSSALAYEAGGGNDSQLDMN